MTALTVQASFLFTVCGCFLAVAEGFIQNFFYQNKVSIHSSKHRQKFVQFASGDHPPKITSKKKNTADKAHSSDSSSQMTKRIILIRHGCTFANEFLARPGTRWGDPTFYDCKSLTDAKLSPRGVQQALGLRQRLSETPDFDIGEVDLIVVSPLTRAIHTLQLGFGIDDQGNNVSTNCIPIIAQPLARERLYLCSDIGETVSSLRRSYPWINFSTEFGGKKADDSPWWYVHNDEKYHEWRPYGEGQTYQCEGEPENDFNKRMVALYDWLDNKTEKNIVLVCHWGVLQWLTGKDYDNCEVDIVPFDHLSRSGFPSLL